MGKKVMIVEDNDLNMKLFRDLIEIGGYEALELRSGSQAVEIALANEPDLIIMDIQLPEVSGLDVIRELKLEPQLKKIPVIAVTAFAMPGDEEAIKAAGCDSYISKPICIETFQTALKKYLL